MSNETKSRFVRGDAFTVLPPMTLAELVQAVKREELSGIGIIGSLEDLLDVVVTCANIDEVLNNFPEEDRRIILGHVIFNQPNFDHLLADMQEEPRAAEVWLALRDWASRTSPGGVSIDEFTPEGQARLSALPARSTDEIARRWPSGALSFRTAFYALLDNLTIANVDAELARLPEDLRNQVSEAMALNLGNFFRDDESGLGIRAARAAAGTPIAGWAALRRWCLRHTHWGIGEVELGRVRSAGRDGYEEQLLEDLPPMTTDEVAQAWQEGRLAFLDAFYKFADNLTGDNVEQQVSRLPADLRQAILNAMLAYRELTIRNTRKAEGRSVEVWQALQRWAKPRRRLTG